MITWPARVPTVDDERPEASSDRAKITLEARPTSGVRVWWAISMVATSVRPATWKVAAAIISMATLIRPARPMAMPTSTIS